MTTETKPATDEEIANAEISATYHGQGNMPLPAPLVLAMCKRITAERETKKLVQQNARDTYSALCAMRNDINEHIPLPSEEADLLQGPEASVFCSTVAQAVIGAITAERERAEKADESRRLTVTVMSEHHDRAQVALIAARQQIAALREALGEVTRAEASDARRLRDAVVEARQRLEKGRALWNGPCHECDAVLAQALRSDNDAEAIARAALAQTEGAEG